MSKPMSRYERERERECARNFAFYDDTPIEKPMPELDQLACGEFKIDPNSRFCDECGFARSDHQRSGKN